MAKRVFTDNCDVWVNQAAIRVEDKLFPLSILLPATVDEQRAIAAELERKLRQVESMRLAAALQVEAISALPGAILREAFDFEP